MARTTEITYRRKTGIGPGAPGFKNACIIFVPDEGTEPRTFASPRNGLRSAAASAVKMLKQKHELSCVEVSHLLDPLPEWCPP
jgi:prephenate dehydrogenase